MPADLYYYYYSVENYARYFSVRSRTQLCGNERLFRLKWRESRTQRHKRRQNKHQLFLGSRVKVGIEMESLRHTLIGRGRVL